MKSKILLLFFINYFSFAQTGINTTDPRTTLDVNGAVTRRQVNFTVASNAVNINTQTSLASITGTATGTVAVTAYTPTINGHILTISNNTTGGFNVTFAGTTIPNGQAVLFVYTNGAWKTTLGSSATATNIYNSNGTLTSNRTITMGANNLTISGSGKVDFLTPVLVGLPKDTRMGLAVVNDAATGDAYGLEKVSAAQTGTTDALRVFTSNNGTAPLVFGKYTNSSAFTEYGKFTNGGLFGIATASPTSTLQVTGSVANSIIIITGNQTLDNTHKTVIIPLASTFTVTLPVAPAVPSRIYSIVNNTVGTKTIGSYINLAGSSINTINASSCVEVQSDGINWYQIR